MHFANLNAKIWHVSLNRIIQIHTKLFAPLVFASPFIPLVHSDKPH